MSSIEASLIVLSGPDEGQRFELLGDQVYSIGRGVKTNFRLHDAEVSRNHACFVWKENSWLFEDRQSANGSRVNQKSITSHRLINGDQIQLGTSTLLFLGSEPETGSQNSLEIDFLAPHSDADVSRIVSTQASDSSAPQASIPASTSDLDQLAQQLIRERDLLYRVSEEAVRPSLSVEQLLDRILEHCIEAVHADRGCVLTVDANSGTILPVSSRYRDERVGGVRMPVSRSIVDYVLKHQQGVRTEDAQHDTRFDAAHSILADSIREAICVPLLGNGAIHGVLYVDTTGRGQAAQEMAPGKRVKLFDERHLQMLVTVGRQVALVIENSRYQKALIKSEQLAAVGHTIAIISHHIKNILQGIRGGSYLVEKGLTQENQDLIRQGWGILERNQDRIYELVLDMLSYSKEREPNWSVGHLNELTAEVIELVKNRAEQEQIQLKVTYSPEIPTSVFDTEAMHRAILNILSNACDAANESGQPAVSVSTHKTNNGQMLEVHITDNGPGLSAKEIAQVFEIFRSSKGAKGTGIGLPVSLKIMREHGGTIDVESEQGKGATFKLKLPLVADPGEQPASRSDMKTMS